VKVKSRTMSPVAASALVGLGAMLVLAAGLFLVVLPQRSRASELDRELASVEAQIATKRAESLRKPQAPIRVADLFKLVQAMPDTADMPGILLELNQTARDAGITFDSIAPQTPAAGTGSVTFPIALEFSGSFYHLTDFVYRLRSLVAVRRGKLDASGRLFSISSIDFSEGPAGFPNVTAKLTVNAYVYGASVPGATPAPTPAPAETSTTGSEPDEPAPSEGATAMGAE
jgi:hypothetical protein